MDSRKWPGATETTALRVAQRAPVGEWSAAMKALEIILAIVFGLLWGALSAFAMLAGIVLWVSDGWWLGLPVLILVAGYDIDLLWNGP